MECVYFFATGFSRREGKEGDEKRDSQEVSGGLQVCLSPIEKKNIAVVCELLCELALGNVTFASLLFVSVAKVWEGGRASFSKKKNVCGFPWQKGDDSLPYAHTVHQKQLHQQRTEKLNPLVSAGVKV